MGGAVLNQSDFSNARLHGARLGNTSLLSAKLVSTDAVGAQMGDARFYHANLANALLTSAQMTGAKLNRANMSGARLAGAALRGADLSHANLTGADMQGADLERAVLVETNLEGANLAGCWVYGISAWNLKLEGSTQVDLVITPYDEPDVVVDNLEVAQFVYLMLTGPKLRQVIDTVVTKAVLILGRFSEERKPVLDAIRDALRRRGYVPILFDWETPAGRDLTETVSTLAHLARFVVADLTDPRSIPHELRSIVPALPSVPVRPIIQEPQREYGMFKDLLAYPWVLPVHHFRNLEDLLGQLDDQVVAPAEEKAAALRPRPAD